jgi:3-hydroxybutyryl-CoA dehydrogenase
MDIKDLEKKGIAILGGGVMGTGIGSCALKNGYPVWIREISDEKCDTARDAIANGDYGFKAAVGRGIMTQDGMDEAMSRLVVTTKVEDLTGCGLVLEAIGGLGGLGQPIENTDMKLKVWAEMEDTMPDGVVFLSNTSAITIATLAAGTKRPELFAGFHMFSPAGVMKLVEITRTKDTNDDTVNLAVELSNSWKKVPVCLNDVPGNTGFVGNRLQAVYNQTANRMLESGDAKSKEDINDALVIGCGWPAGIFQANARTGWKGKAQGEGSIKDVPNGELIVKTIYADMLTQAKVILEEGVAASEEDIDLCMKHGFRHPKGPFEMTAS